MRILTFVAAIVVGVAGWLPAQTVDFSPANLDGTQPVPGRVFTATLTCPQGVGAAYVLAFDIFPATPPIKLAGFGELGLGMTPAFMIMKAGGLNAQGKDTFSLALPNAPALVGARFYLQALVYAPAAPQGAWLSNLYVGDISAAGTHTLVPSRAMIPRALHTATLLNDGRVLLVGGGNGTLTNPQGTQTTEVYYPWTKKFDYTRTTQGTVTRLNGLRVMHTATLLDDGRVLIAGGVDSQGNVLATAEVFDPATGRFAYVGNLVQARATHSATKLPDGRVLIAGGTTANFVYPNVFGGASNSTEVFDPGTSAFKSGPSMGDKHMLHSAVSLTYNNKDYVVVLSGIKGLSLFIFPSYSSKADVYDVAAGSFTGKIDGRSVGSVRSARAAMGAAVQGNGRVLVVGGVNGSVPRRHRRRRGTQSGHRDLWFGAQHSHGAGRSDHHHAAKRPGDRAGRRDGLAHRAHGHGVVLSLREQHVPGHAGRSRPPGAPTPPCC